MRRVSPKSAQLPPDPAGVFRSDYHRRALAHLRAPHDDGDGTVDAGAPIRLLPGDPNIQSEQSIFERLHRDLGADWTREGQGSVHPLLAVLPNLDFIQGVYADLIEDGLAVEAGDGYQMTDEGFALLQAPIANEPPPWTMQRIKAAFEEGTLDEAGVKAWAQATGHDVTEIT